MITASHALNKQNLTPTPPETIVTLTYTTVTNQMICKQLPVPWYLSTAEQPLPQYRYASSLAGVCWRSEGAGHKSNCGAWPYTILLAVQVNAHTAAPWDGRKIVESLQLIKHKGGSRPPIRTLGMGNVTGDCGIFAPCNPFQGFWLMNVTALIWFAIRFHVFRNLL